MHFLITSQARADSTAVGNTPRSASATQVGGLSQTGATSAADRPRVGHIFAGAAAEGADVDAVTGGAGVQDGH